VRPWLVGVGGGVLAAAGVALFWRANTAPGAGVPFASYEPLSASSAYQSRLDLQFDDRWAVLWAAGHLAGLALFAAGLLVLAGLAGWGWGRRRARPAVRRALVLGAVGAALAVGGIAVVLAGGGDPVVSYAGSYEAVGCAGVDCWSAAFVAPQVAGLGMALTGTLGVAAVAGRLLAGDVRGADGDEGPDLQ
jgi:hypothetical protein